MLLESVNDAAAVFACILMVRRFRHSESHLLTTRRGMMAKPIASPIVAAFAPQVTRSISHGQYCTPDSRLGSRLECRCCNQAFIVIGSVCECEPGVPT